MHISTHSTCVSAALVIGILPAFAHALTGITAEEAFYAVQNGTDPASGLPASVALVDVRTRAEYYWVGAPTEVLEIVPEDSEEPTIVPDDGMVTLDNKGKLLAYAVDGQYQEIKVKHVAELVMSPIAINIPVKLWDEATATTVDNPHFYDDVAGLSADYDVVILSCRSGVRSDRGVDFENSGMFTAVYEIDDGDPDGGVGGFEGTSYSNVFNGYRGFPGRVTKKEDLPSVSWKDAGLPIKTGINPLAQ